MNEHIEIRHMRQEDLDQVAEIERENFSLPWSRKSFADFIGRADAVFLVAVTDCYAEEIVAGYIGFYGIPNEGDITNVSVRSRFRRKGIGRKLVNALIAETLARGITRIFLEVRKSNSAAIFLYEGAGFKKVGLRRNYYEKPEEDAVIMLREEEEEK